MFEVTWQDWPAQAAGGGVGLESLTLEPHLRVGMRPGPA